MLCAIGGLFKVCEIKEMDYKVGELLSPRLSLFLVFFKEPLKAVMVFTLRKKSFVVNFSKYFQSLCISPSASFSLSNS